MKKIIPLLVLSCLLLTSCLATDSFLQDPVKTYAYTKATYDQFKDSTWVNAPEYGTSYNYNYLRAYIAGGELSFIQLYLVRRSSGYDFHSAYDINTNQLQFTEIDNYWMTVGDPPEYTNTRIEHAGVTLKYNELVKHRSSGLAIKVYGKNGNDIIEIPGPYIDGFLLFIESSYSTAQAVANNW